MLVSPTKYPKKQSVALVCVVRWLDLFILFISSGHSFLDAGLFFLFKDLALLLGSYAIILVRTDALLEQSSIYPLKKSSSG